MIEKKNSWHFNEPIESNHWRYLKIVRFAFDKYLYFSKIRMRIFMYPKWKFPRLRWTFDDRNSFSRLVCSLRIENLVRPSIGSCFVSTGIDLRLAIYTSIVSSARIDVLPFIGIFVSSNHRTLAFCVNRVHERLESLTAVSIRDWRAVAGDVAISTMRIRQDYGHSSTINSKCTAPFFSLSDELYWMFRAHARHSTLIILFLAGRRKCTAITGLR